MSKLVISKLFLYRYRFYIGYIILGLAFIALVFCLPLISPAGLSDLERQSAVTSYNIGRSDRLTVPHFAEAQYPCLRAYAIRPKTTVNSYWSRPWSPTYFTSKPLV